MQQPLKRAPGLHSQWQVDLRWEDDSFGSFQVRVKAFFPDDLGMLGVIHAAARMRDVPFERLSYVEGSKLGSTITVAEIEAPAGALEEPPPPQEGCKNLEGLSLGPS